MTEVRRRPQTVNGIPVRIPKDYSFHTVDKDLSIYKEGKDFILRTDTPYEKQVLKDWYRSLHKTMTFTFVPFRNEYVYRGFSFQFFNLFLENQNHFKKYPKWKGVNEIGASNAFEMGNTTPNPRATTRNIQYNTPNKNIHCARLYEIWFACDRIAKIDEYKTFLNPENDALNLQPHQVYPCYKEYSDAESQCNPRLIAFLHQLAYLREIEHHVKGQFNNLQLVNQPLMFDTAKKAERVTLTY